MQSKNGSGGRRCIIHIGMYKTGSSSIQHSLAGFKNGQFLYAALGRESNHSLALLSLFSDRPILDHRLHKAARRDHAAVGRYIEAARSGLDKSIDRAGSRTLLISGEAAASLRPNALQGLRDFLARHFDQITIVAYVRPPSQLIASSFQERVKAGTIKDFDTTRLYRHYQRLLAKFDTVFGRDNVHLWKFDPNTFPEGCVVQDFCSRLAIPLSKTKIVRVNESVSRETVGLLYAYHKFGETDERPRMRSPAAMEFGAFIGGKKFRFSPDLIRALLQANEEDIQWVEDRLGQSLREELGTHNDGDVRDEADLLEFDAVAVRKLSNAVGRDVPSKPAPRDIAGLVGAWHDVYVARPLWRRILTGRLSGLLERRPS
jgi:hypothetical protein